MLRRGTYNDKPRLPCVLGYEVLGRAITAGSSTHESVIGKRVVALTRLGGYARHAIARMDAVIEVGEKIDANSALALALQGSTAYYMACHIAPVRAGEWVLVHAAAGGVGSLLVQLAKSADARLFSYGGAQLTHMKYGVFSQLNFLRQMGAVLPVFWAMQSISLIGVNVLRLLDARPDTVRNCLHAILALHASGQIRPQTGGNFAIAELAQAHEMPESGQSSGKIAASCGFN